ncbi:MAG TPA: sigma 54-interacting transcriptional regulator [Planctomycetota bacterium]|jgi:transcriptional regulator with GAF, ATPase, and Fis domain|nr:sigma 54-interacting transcriptional regulator [Planctomycetota bacterium]
MSRLKLTVFEDGARNDLLFERLPITVGRALGNDVRLKDPRASRRHCRIEGIADGFVLVDEGSQNGTLVNGAAVARVSLAPGDVIQVGKTRIFFDHPGEGGAAPLPAGEATSVDAVVRERDDLYALVRINRALNAESALEPLLTKIVDAGIELTRAERGFVILEDPSRPSGGGGGGAPLRYEVARNFAGEAVAMPPAKFLSRIAEPVWRSSRPLLVVDAAEDERFREALSIEEMRLRSVMAVPLPVGGSAAGVLAVDHRLRAGAFSEDDLDLLDALAQQAGIAIGNARRLEEARRQGEEIERLNRALARRVEDQERELEKAREELGERRPARHPYRGIVGRSPAMREVFRALDRIVLSDLPVLLEGESGTGKELIARAIHEHGSRRRGPFVAESCAALPDHLLASELFGHTRGAFTGADRARKGLLELAHGGTLFLDEVGEMSTDLQKKLLRVLEDGEVRALGADAPVRVEVRLLCASNRDLSELVRHGEFREDLFFRLNVLPLRLPPLRERGEDIPELLDHFLGAFCREAGTPKKRLRPEVLDLLARHAWPGNVRELENEVRKWVVFAGEEVGVEALSRSIREGTPLRADRFPGEEGGTLPERVERLERRAIEEALARFPGNKTAAAKSLGVSRFTLQRKMAKLGIEGGDDAGALPEEAPSGDAEDEET